MAVKEDLLKLSHEEAMLKVYWEDVLKHIRKDLGLIWTEEVKKDFDGIEEEAENIIRIFRRLHAYYKNNEKSYKKSLLDIEKLLSHLDEKVKSKPQWWIKTVRDDLAEIISDIDKTLSRRNFLFGMASAAGLALAPKVYSKEKSVKDALEYMSIRSKVYNPYNKRELLVIGEIHNAKYHTSYGRIYNHFFNTLNNIHKIDKIFYECAYAGNHPVRKDGYYDYKYDFHVFVGLEPDPYKGHKERDKNGYYGLSEKFDVIGIEDPRLSRDYFRLFNILHVLMEELYEDTDEGTLLKKRPEIEKKIRDSARRFELIHPPIKESYPDTINRNRKKKYLDEMESFLYKVEIEMRNKYFAEVIDKHLEKTGALIVGEGHVEGNKYNPMMLPALLNKRNIKVIYVEMNHIVEKLFLNLPKKPSLYPEPR